jgi:hypothetical protein
MGIKKARFPPPIVLYSILFAKTCFLDIIAVDDDDCYVASSLFIFAG